MQTNAINLQKTHFCKHIFVQTFLQIYKKPFCANIYANFQKPFGANIFANKLYEFTKNTFLQTHFCVNIIANL